MDLSFSGAGFMGTYYFGVADCWKRFVPRNRVNRLAGASAGSLTAAYWLMDEPLDKCLINIMGLIDGVRQRPLGVFDRSHQIVDLLPVVLDAMLPDDAHKRVGNKLHVAITRLKDMKKVIINEFESKQDLIEALNCSCFIPVWSGNHVSTFRGEKHIDGGFSDNLPVFDEHTIRCCCFAGQTDISPIDKTRIELLSAKIINTPFFFNFNNMKRLGRALFPPPASYVLSLLKQGFHDTREFLLTNDLIQCDACYCATDPSKLRIFSINEPTITPRASPGVSRANSYLTLTKSCATPDKTPNNNLDVKHTNVVGGADQKSTFASLLKQKLSKLSTTKMTTTKQDKNKTQFYSDENQNNLEQNCLKIPQVPIIITTTDCNDDNNNNKHDELRLNGSTTTTTAKVSTLKLRRQSQANNQALLSATNERFAFAPNSCPPSPSLARHCAECLRLRQAARMAELDEELVEIALKFHTPPSAVKLAVNRLATKPVRWLRSLAFRRKSYNPSDIIAS